MLRQWQEYTRELYDETNKTDTRNENINNDQVADVTEREIKGIISKLPKNKSTNDGILADF